jgi:hypothetical protein
VHSNLQGLVRLARELTSALPLERRRRLWTESGEGFAARLDQAMAEAAD